jgi:hypothetical protein
MTINKITEVKHLEVNTNEGLFNVSYKNNKVFVEQLDPATGRYFPMGEVLPVSVEVQNELTRLGWKLRPELPTPDAGRAT